MKAQHGIPLALGIAAILSAVILVPAHRQQKAGAARMAALTAPHNPDHYQFPLCTSRDNDWGLYRRKTDYAWYVVKQKGGESQRVNGHWSQYPELTNLFCSES